VSVPGRRPPRSGRVGARGREGSFVYLVDPAVKDAVSGTRDGAELDVAGGRLFLTPVPAERGPDRAACAKGVFHLLHVQSYGWTEPYWMYLGEGRLAWSGERTGRDPPRVADSLFEDLPSTPITFKELVAMESGRSGEDVFQHNALAYVLFFEAGPQKYRKAYDAFRAAFGATHDVRRSTEEHLLSLDQEEMKADLDHWLHRSVKGVEVK